jgi:DNA-directed RNA polymerase
MTTVYGVTFIGARDQIHRQLKNAEDHGSIDIYPWANYLAKVVSILSLIKVLISYRVQTLSCIGTLFKGAKGIQVWLNDCARLISKSIPEDRVKMMLLANRDHKDSPAQLSVTRTRQWMADKKAGKEQMTTVVWTTLLGLPIVQPYRKAGRKQVSCLFLGNSGPC